MKTLYTKEQFNQAKYKDLLPLECTQCQKEYLRPKKVITRHIRDKSKHNFCSRKCTACHRGSMTPTKCGYCEKQITIRQSRIDRSKSNKVFCSRSCGAIYNNAHKTHGYSRSKIETWLETQLTELYPNLHILYNNRTVVKPYELDIYISSLNLAIELNGIFHYEPVFGVDKLKKIQKNDNNKFYLCQQNMINLCIIDITGMTYFKPQKAQKFLDIITNLVNNIIDD